MVLSSEPPFLCPVFWCWRWSLQITFLLFQLALCLALTKRDTRRRLLGWRKEKALVAFFFHSSRWIGAWLVPVVFPAKGSVSCAAVSVGRSLLCSFFGSNTRCLVCLLVYDIRFLTVRLYSLGKLLQEFFET